MIGLIVRRVLGAIPLLFVVSLGVFSLLSLVPGDAAVTLAGGLNATPDGIERVRDALHLNDPFLVQYWRWLRGVLSLDFGNSLASGAPIGSELGQRFVVTFGMVLVVFAFLVPLALAFGVAGGLRPGTRWDRALTVVTSAMLAMPGFWVAGLLVTVLAIKLRWLPPFGYTPFGDSPIGWAKGMIMPAVALSLASMAVLSRQVRAGLADTMQSAFIRTAWAKGGSTRQVVVGHALKNSAIPAVTVLGLQIAGLLGAGVVVEQIFAIPGLGSYLLGAINAQDLPVVQAVAMLFVVVNVLANLSVDIAYGFLNPKVRAE